MSVKCSIGVHDWSGCTCLECGKIRNSHHDLAKDCEKCEKCGQEFEDEHNWSKDCEKCSACGKTRAAAHHWLNNCEKCSTCGQTRKDIHKMVDGMCSLCGHGVFTDTDGKKYKVVKIGNQIIMSENYAKIPDEGNFWVYEDEQGMSYDHLYDFDTARKIAPKGWHLPSKEEFQTLYHSMGGHTTEAFKQMKMNGDTGFDAVFDGWRSIRGVFNGLHASAHFWINTSEDENHVWQFVMNTSKHHAEFEKAEKGLGLSIRYFKDK